MSHLARRQFLGAAGAGVATLALAPLSALGRPPAAAPFTLPPLPYAFDALEPTIDAETMRIHHDRHHQAYVTGLNAAVAKAPALAGKTLPELLANNAAIAPEPVKQAIINMGGGHFNHSLFWQIMGPRAGGEPAGPLGRAITAAFGSFDAFKTAFHQAAMTQFGSGWAWLVVGPRNTLQVVKLPNQNAPIMTGLKPLLGIDVWEHAYYLKYKNDRGKYATEWWKVVNWPAVAGRHEAALKA